MLNLKRISFLIAVVLFTFTSVLTFGQDEEKNWEQYPYPLPREKSYSDFVSKNNQDQQDRFLKKKYTHPSSPKNQWEIGLATGPMWINGDVKVRPLSSGGPGWGFGGHVRKSLGYIFSIRGSLSAGTAYGQNWEPTQGWNIEDTRNFAYLGNTVPGSYYDDFNDDFATPDYSDTPLSIVYYNHKTYIYEGLLSGVINFNNVKFHKKRNKFSWYGYGGPGGVIYRTKMNQLDESGNTYDYVGQVYNTILQEAVDPPKILDWDRRERSIELLENLWDDTYESQAERHRDDRGVDLLEGHNYQFTVHAGTGVAMKLNRRINVGLDTRINITRDDLLDGQRWQEWGALTRDFDTYNFTSVNLNFNLGGANSVEPLWWMSPLDYAYNELQNPDIDFPEPFKLLDDDGDGVPNEFDDEPNTAEGCAVNTRGVALDSDGDGIIDCEDKQPHTPFDLVGGIDVDGVATRPEIPTPECNCPTPVVQPSPPSCGDWFLPMIHFDLNKDNVKTEFYPHMHQIAMAMQACPSMNVAVVGHTDSRASDSYNNDLSCRRAEAAINYLVTNYGIDRYRFTKSYSGESSNLVKGAKTDKEHYLNRRVEFLTGGNAGMYTDVGGCGTVDSYDAGGSNSGGSFISSDSYYGTGGSNSIFIDK